MGPHNFKVRAARVEDAEALVRLHFDAVHENASDDYPAEVLDSWSPSPDENRFSWMRSQIIGESNRVLVAELGNGKAGGFCMFSPSESFIYAVYVDPRSARNGIGQRLLRAAEGAIAQQGGRHAKLNASRNALEFYESEGYQVIEPTTQCLVDGSRMECFEMQKKIPAAT